MARNNLIWIKGDITGDIYYDHIIRSAEEWERISRYIIANPINWAE